MKQSRHEISEFKAQEDAVLGTQIEAVFKHHLSRYGYRRIQVELKKEGQDCATEHIWRLMKARGLVASSPSKFTPRTSDGRADAPSPNRIADRRLMYPNEIWVGDITYVPTDSGWHYMAVVMDLCSKPRYPAAI